VTLFRELFAFCESAACLVTVRYLIIGVIVYVVMGALNNPELKAQMAQAQAQAGK